MSSMMIECVICKDPNVTFAEIVDQFVALDDVKERICDMHKPVWDKLLKEYVQHG